MANFENDLFGAIKVMTDAAISKINFDRTEIYTIVSPVENEEYYYNVTNGTYTFKAYASNYQEYKNGASVYIQIPQNDYSQTKFIIGEAGTKDPTATENYLSPLDSMVIFAEKDNLKLGIKYSLNENEFFPYKEFSWNENDIELATKYFRLGLYTEIKNIDEQKFRLKITSFNKNKEGEDQETAEWSCEEMYGDYRRYYYPFPQEFLHTFSGTNFQIDLEVEDSNGNWIIPEKTNIEINNIKAFVGYAQNAFKRETLILGSTTELLNPQDLTPNLEAFWIRKNEITKKYYRETDIEKFKFDSIIDTEKENLIEDLTINWEESKINWIDSNDESEFGNNFLSLIENEYIEQDNTNNITINNSDLKNYLENSSKLNTQRSSVELHLTNSENYDKIYQNKVNNYRLRLQLNVKKPEIILQPSSINLKFAIGNKLKEEENINTDLWFEGSEAKIELDEKDLYYYLIIDFHCDINTSKLTDEEKNKLNDLIKYDNQNLIYYDLFNQTNINLFPIEVTFNKSNLGGFSWFNTTTEPARKTDIINLTPISKFSLKWYKFDATAKEDKMGNLNNWRRKTQEIENYTFEIKEPEALPNFFNTQTFKCIIQNNEQNFEKELIYSQKIEDNTIAEDEIVKETGFSIKLADNSNGRYNSYDHTGHLATNSYITGTKSLQVISVKDEPITSIRWYVPKTGTMLSFSNTEIGTKEDGTKIYYWDTIFPNDDETAYNKNDYDTYYKAYETGVTETKALNYDLKTIYDPALVNNTVTCFINEKYVLTKTFSFGTLAAQGADYDASLTLVHTKKDENGEWKEDTKKTYEKKCWYLYDVYRGDVLYPNSTDLEKENPNYITEDDTEKSTLWFRFNIYNNLGAIINNNVTITWKFLHFPATYTHEGNKKIFYYHSEDLTEKVTKDGIYKFSISEVFNFKKQQWPEGNEKPQLNILSNYASYTVAKITFTINKITYTKYFPIPLSDCEDVWFVSTPTYFTYDATGTNPSWANENIKIYYIPDENGNIKSEEIDIKKEDTEQEDTEYSVERFEVISPNGTAPDFVIKQSTIEPPPTFAVTTPDNTFYRIRIQNIQNGTSTVSSKNYHHPIIIQQDLWSIDLLNKWDNSYKIDNNNAFFANVGVGKHKGANNTFTGVLMGINQGDNNAYGLYGFKNGENIFKLNNDGEFFVGDANNHLKFIFSDSLFSIKTKSFRLEDVYETLIIDSDGVTDENKDEKILIKGSIGIQDADKKTKSVWGTRQFFTPYWFILSAPNPIRVTKVKFFGQQVKHLDSNDAIFIGMGTEPISPTWSTTSYTNNQHAGVVYSPASDGGNSTRTLFVGIDGQSSKLGTRNRLCLYSNTGSTNVVSSIELSSQWSQEASGVRGGHYIWFRTFGTTIFTTPTVAIRPYSNTGGDYAINGSINLTPSNDGGVISSPNRLEITADSSFYSLIFNGDKGTSMYGNSNGANIYFQSNNVDNTGGTIGRLRGNWYKGSNGSTAVSSDINKKNSIVNLEDSYSILFDNLQPVTYKYNDGTSNRLHTGFIAQQVKDALDKANISTQDFAGLVILNKDTEQADWYLRYEEFIALNTNEIQKLKKRVNQLETEVSSLKEQLLNI